MIPLQLTAPPSLTSLSSLCVKPFPLNKPFTSTAKHHHKHHLQKRKGRIGICRAELSTDVPIGVAIGATILYSLAFPVTSPPEDDDEEGGSVIDSADARFAVMGIISFLPYFNWLSWMFAWLDTGKQRYAVYALVYLAPYLRPDLSISPEESWLPIASIIIGIIHVQLEAGIKNGDIQGIWFFNKVQNHFSSNARNSHEISEEKRFKNHLDLPSQKEHGWRIPKNPSENRESTSDDEKADEGKKH